MAAEYILKEGNDDVILCERGIRTFETATRNTLDISAVPVIKLASHLPVIVDPSHSAGGLDLVLPLSLAAVAAGADGVLVETHPNPEHALCDGPQSLPTAVFGEYAGRVLDLARWAGKTSPDAVSRGTPQHRRRHRRRPHGRLARPGGAGARRRRRGPRLQPDAGHARPRARAGRDHERLREPRRGLHRRRPGLRLHARPARDQARPGGARRGAAARGRHRCGEHEGAAHEGALSRGAAALHRRAPALRLRERRRRQRARLALRRGDVLPHARHARGRRCLPVAVRVPGGHRRPPGGRRPRGARPPDGGRQPPAARAGQRAHDPGRPARRRSRRAALGGAQLPRPHPHRRQQPACLDRHLPRQPRRAAGLAGDLPGWPAGSAGGAGRQRRRQARRHDRSRRRAARTHASRRQPAAKATSTASSSRSATAPASSARSWSRWATPASTSRTSRCTI